MANLNVTHYGGFGDAFGSSFVQGLLGMMKLDLDREQLAAETQQKQQDFTLRQAADERAGRMADINARQAEFNLNELTSLPGDVSSIYGAAAPQAAAQTTRPYSPTEPELGDLTSYTPGRGPALTYGDLIQRGVDPAAIGRVSRLAPSAVQGLGLMTPEGASDYQRKQDGIRDLDTLLSQPKPETMTEQAQRMGAITAAGLKAGVFSGPEAAKRLDDAWRRDPALIDQFMRSYQDAYAAQAKEAVPSFNGTVLRLRSALAQAITENPRFLIENPEFAKEIGADQILKAGPQERKGPIFAPKDTAGYYDPNTGEFKPITPAPGAAAAGKPTFAPKDSPGYVDKTGTFVPITPGPGPGPKDVIDQITLETTKANWPGNTPGETMAKQIFAESMTGLRNSQRFIGKAPADISALVQEAVNQANRAAFPDRYRAGTPPPPVGQGIIERLWNTFTSASTLGAMGQGPPPGQIPSPVGAGAPGAAPPAPTGIGQARGRGGEPPPPLPGIGADATMTPGTVVTPRAPAPGPSQGPIRANPPPSANYTMQDQQGEMQRLVQQLVQAGVPVEDAARRARAAMKATGW